MEGTFTLSGTTWEFTEGKYPDAEPGGGNYWLNQGLVEYSYGMWHWIKAIDGPEKGMIGMCMNTWDDIKDIPLP